jgi:8-oxo-dGTP pyrophosphatase MutT (NUDIX family)
MIPSADTFLDDDRPLAPSDAVAAIIVGADGRYLLQLRDDKPGIFYPGHWGCFGGAIEKSDASVEEALLRELAEEIGVDLGRGALQHFSTVAFGLEFAGLGVVRRTYYEARIDERQAASLRLGEGSRLGFHAARDALGMLRVTPYDAFALWLHANRARLKPYRGEEAR